MSDHNVKTGGESPVEDLYNIIDAIFRGEIKKDEQQTSGESSSGED